MAVDDRHAEDGPGRLGIPFAVLLVQPRPHVPYIEDLSSGSRITGDLGQRGALQVEGGGSGDERLGPVVPQLEDGGEGARGAQPALPHVLGRHRAALHPI